MKEPLFYLIDLERSIRSGLTTYWKPNKNGYTQNLKEAGQYSNSQASKAFVNDFNNRTVCIETSNAESLFKWPTEK